MAHGILGIIACPMLEDNLVYSLRHDDERKRIVIIDNENNGSIRRKLERAEIPYKIISMEDFISNAYSPDADVFNMVSSSTVVFSTSGLA